MALTPYLIRDMKAGKTIYILEGMDGILWPYIKLRDAYNYPVSNGFVQQPLSLSTISAKLRTEGAAWIEKGNDKWIIHKTKLL